MDPVARREAILEAQRKLAQNPVFLDTETTGTGPNAEIIEVAVVDREGVVLLDSLVKPRGAIEPDAARVHGLTLSELQDSPTWQDLWPQVEVVLQGRLIGAYNSEFDLRMMKQSHQRYWLSWRLPEESFFCIMKLYARYYGEWNSQRRDYRWRSLDAAGKDLHIPLPNAHRAKDDTLLARAILLAMADG